MATKTLAGEKGTFEITTTGNRFRIRFTPKRDAVDCDNIGLLQTARIEVDGKAVKPSDISRTFRHLDDDATAAGTFVDHLATEKDPYYNGDDRQDHGDQGRSDPDKPESRTNPSPATLTDAPNVPAAGDVTVFFEICAYCIGANGEVDTSKPLGCVKVKFTQKKGKAGIAEPDGDKVGDPSGEHKEAVKKFDKNHTDDKGKRKCPDKGLKDPGGIKNPINDFPSEEDELPEGAGMKRPVPFEDEQALFDSLDRYLERLATGLLMRRLPETPIREFVGHVLETPHLAKLGCTMPIVRRVKFTNVGPQIKNLASLIFRLPEDLEAASDLEAFAPFRDPCVHYDADEVVLRAVPVAQSSLDGIAEAILGSPSCEPQDAAVSATVLLERAGETDGKEVLLSPEDVAPVLERSFAATDPSESDARDALGIWHDTFGLV